MKAIETCYKCGAPATSREHVPPLCFFPEKKDIKFDVFRKNLITVPSCDEHNSMKSKDDEFLFVCISGIVGNNALGYFQTKTKAKRTFDRRGKDFINAIIRNGKEKIIHTEDGKQHAVIEGRPHTERMVKAFQHIAYALFYTEYKKIFDGECVIFPAFLRYEDENLEKIKAVAVKSFELQSEKFQWPVKGDNPHVFKYQFGQADHNRIIPLKMTFYESTIVFAAFKDKTAPEPFDLVMKLIEEGMSVTVTYDDGQNIEFNK
jgi:hypothetical protein